MPRFFRSVFKIEYILLFIALFTLGSTLSLKVRVSHKFDALDLALDSITDEMSPPCILGGGYSISSEVAVSKLLEPYLYFGSTLSSLATNLDDTILPNTLKNYLHAQQRRILFGFDSLFLFSAILCTISVAIIIIDVLTQKSLLVLREVVDEAQAKFSRDLHDSVSQDLAAAKIYLQKGEREKTEFYLDCALRETRYLIDSLHIRGTEPIEDLIRQNFEAFESNWGIKTNVYIASSMLSRLSGEAQVELLRILQEALSNIARHAFATEVSLKIIDLPSAVKIVVQDNGTGFVKNSKVQDSYRKHYGIANMKERVASLGGTIEIKNEGGCTIAITIGNTVH